MKTKVQHIKKEELVELLKEKSSNYQYIDVRTPGEYRSGKLKPFVNLPLQNFQNAEHELDKSKPVVLICASGMRSRMAAKMLIRLNFETVINVKGGLAAVGR